MDKELTILYLKTYNRKPSNEELKEYLEKLVEGELTLDDVKKDLNVVEEDEENDESNDVDLDIEYDASVHEITINPLSTSKYDGVILSNGKICVKSSQLPTDSGDSEITTTYSLDELGYHNNNVVQGFKFTGIRFFDIEGEVSITNLIQRLNIHNAYLEQTYDVANNENNLEVKHELRALHQFPYCFLHRCIITNPNDEEIEFDLYNIHEPSGLNLTQIKYKQEFINNENIYTLSGYDIYRKITIVSSSIYKFVDGFSENLVNGFVEDGKISLKLRLAANSTGTFDIITGMMTTSDFADPVKELQRILINVKDTNLIAEHNQDWINIWNTSNITVSKKTDIVSEKLEAATKSVQLYQRNIKYSLYNIFSLLRDDVNVDNNLLNLSAFDRDGEIFWNAEMFLVPLLLIFNSNYAKVLLDFRFKQMDFAKNVALAYKHKGSQFPYRENISNYKDVFWAPNKPAVAFNTGLIGINTWNYYRVSNDHYWLSEKGFSILQNCAKYFQSLFDENNNLKNVHTVSGTDEENNSLTRYLGISVIKYYIEANYVLKLNVEPDIHNLYENVKNNFVSLRGEVNYSNNIEMPVHIKIKKNVKNQLEFCNYNTNEILGNKFGRLNGRYLKINDNVEYRITIEKDVFINFYKNDFTKIDLSYLIDHKILYSKEYGFSDGYIVLLGSNLFSYQIESEFVNNAFTNLDSEIKLNNIISRPDSESSSLLETHLILMHYYSKLFFNSINPVSKVNIIKDNSIYYTSIDNSLDSKLIMLNLDCLLAQEMSLTTDKEFYLNKFESGIDRILMNKENDLTKPWGNHQNHTLFIFNILTAMFRFRIKGSISDQRLVIDPFIINREAGSCIMPKYWDHVDVVYNKNNVSISNNIS